MHIIKCSECRTIYGKYCEELKTQLRTVEMCNHDKDEVDMIVADIEVFLNRWNQEYITTQHLVEIVN